MSLKKWMFFLFLSALLYAAAPTPVSAAIKIDTSMSPKGLALIEYTGDLSKEVKVLVDYNGTQNVYVILDEKPNYVPLQMGAGTYKISVLQRVTSNKYKPLASQSITVNEVDQNAMFSSNTLLINFSNEMKSITAYKKLTEGSQKNDAINTIYSDVVKSYVYDFEKAKKIPVNYVPIIDDVYDAKKGICYDYSALLASTLRSQGIPTKLVMGYAPDIEEYHAWNEILIDGKWVVVDTTYDSQLFKAGVSYTFAKDADKRKIVKVF